MSSTAECIKEIMTHDLTRFERLIEGNTTDWKRVNKFNYRFGFRRYFYLLNSCLLATVDSVAGRLYTIVRPPMQWELYMLIDLRQNDQYLCENAYELYQKHYDFVESEAIKGSEAQQYYFMMGDEDGGWIYFNPHKMDGYDEHLWSDLYHLLPEWLRDDEAMECTYATTLAGDRTMDEIKQELIDLGFEYRE